MSSSDAESAPKCTSDMVGLPKSPTLLFAYCIFSDLFMILHNTVNFFSFLIVFYNLFIFNWKIIDKGRGVEEEEGEINGEST